MYFYFICKDCGNIGYNRSDYYSENNILYCKGCRKKLKISNIISNQGLRFGLYYENYDDNIIADILGLKESTISEWRIRNNLPKLFEKEDKRINNSLIYGLLNFGLSDKKISEIINRSTSTVAIWRRNRNLESNNHKRIYIEKICGYCNKEFKSSKTHSIFCCSDCNYEYSKFNPFRIDRSGLKGKNHPNWIKDRTKLKTPKKETLRKSTKFKEWRKKIFDRDNYSCQICHDRGKKGHWIEIHSHHIKSFADFPKDRFNIDNGITLCKSCHVWVHHLNPLNFQ